jgi:hypothetical protein
MPLQSGSIASKVLALTALIGSLRPGVLAEALEALPPNGAKLGFCRSIQTTLEGDASGAEPRHYAPF